MSCEVRDIIVEKWLEGSKPFQIGLQLNLPRKTISNAVDRFARTGSVQPGVGENKIRTARTDDVVLHTEFCKRQRPSVYAAEVQKELIENQVVLPANVPSQASISGVLTSDFGYSYKKMTIVPKRACGFHHVHQVEPVLQNMLGLSGFDLVFQPPYHSVYNTCEHCFRFFKSRLLKNSELAEHHTEVAISDALSGNVKKFLHALWLH